MHCVVVVSQESMIVYGVAPAFKATEERTTVGLLAGGSCREIQYQYFPGSF